MNVLEYFELASKNLIHRQARSWLTMIGIFISIATIFTLLSISLGLNSAIDEQFQSLGTDKIFVQPKGGLGIPGMGGSVELTDGDAKFIGRISGVNDYSYYSISTVKVEDGKRDRYVTSGGIPLDKTELWYEGGLLKIDSGEFIQTGDVGKVVVGYQYKYKEFLETPVDVGDKITLNDKDFRVKGILKSQGSPPDDQSVFMSMKDFRELFPDSGERVDMILVKVEPGSDVIEVGGRIEERLRRYRDVTEKTQDFSISTPQELLESFNTILLILTVFLVGIGGISLVVGGIGIANTMYTSVIERTKEIGIMKSIGAQNRDILYIFMIEAGVLGAIGGIVGVMLGYIIAKIIEMIAIASIGEGLLRAAAPWYLFLGCVAFAFIVGVISGFFPARHAARMRPVDAIRYE